MFLLVHTVLLLFYDSNFTKSPKRQCFEQKKEKMWPQTSITNKMQKMFMMLCHISMWGGGLLIDEGDELISIECNLGSDC